MSEREAMQRTLMALSDLMVTGYVNVKRSILADIYTLTLSG